MLQHSGELEVKLSHFHYAFPIIVTQLALSAKRPNLNLGAHQKWHADSEG